MIDGVPPGSMPLTEVLAVFDDAIAAAPRGRRSIALHLHKAQTYGQRGHYVGQEDGKPVYGYTTRQVKAMRGTVYEALREAARA